MSFEQHFRIVVEKVFNYWPDLKLAVEHGMGGRNGQQTAIEIMEYTYNYCIKNDKITEGELQDVIEDLMDQEFNTLCDDNSIPEICKNLLRYLQMCKEEKYSEIEAEFQRLPPGKEWLRGAQIVPICQDDSSSDDEGSDSDEDMDIDENEASSSRSAPAREKSPFVEPEPGWTTVRTKRKN
ncbi:pre-rRNA-processing protein TSR2 homolog [Episyrphus balteatus]|uniref:pre-rRNA-processing protein TSR2 homolog n=1 Tax=Episyrphus balteatus TaxID=286459 RepID=UPI002486562E|nr:pre-rRNA-processing protein TSR2 homolog [Episyrphus balteatus]